MSEPNFIQRAFLSLWTHLTGLNADFWHFLFPIIVSDGGKLLVSLTPIALEIVQSLATSGKSGNEKRSEAFTQIEQAALAQGIATTASVINTAIELSVQNLQSTAAKAETPAA